MENNAASLFKDLRRGDIKALARSITLVESNRKVDLKVAEVLLDKCQPFSGKSVRIGITGVPGVGKSTFIESFGKYLTTKKNKKVAVLAVDPTSIRSKGSIMGDKTRMQELSSDKKAFIRPSPSSGSLGGVGLATREIIVLCEAASYDVILVETVGVGQSETDVREMTDFFMLLMLPGAGDELQGIKRGIVEIADAIFINKSDGDNMTKARQALSAYKSALQLFPSSPSGWKPLVELCSATEVFNIDKAWKIVSDYANHCKKNGYFEDKRSEQLKKWYGQSVEHFILRNYREMPAYKQLFSKLEKDVLNGKLSPRKATRLFLDQLVPA